MIDEVVQDSVEGLVVNRYSGLGNKGRSTYHTIASCVYREEIACRQLIKVMLFEELA
jgi:hypothetical protein